MNPDLLRHPLACIAMLICVAGCTPRAKHAESPPVDGHRILNEAISAMRNEALGRDRVNWDEVQSGLEERLAADAPPRDAWPLINEAIAALNDPHARFIPAAPAIAQPSPTETPSAAPAQKRATPEVPTEPVGRLLEGGVAYLLIPIRGHADEATLRSYAARTRSLIAEFAKSSPRGWVIDLRLNGGGTMWPMFLGLAPLLGNGVGMTSVVDGRTTASFGITENEVWIDHGGGRQVQLALPAGAPFVRLPKPRVAVLLGPWTMSSGESVAIALRSLPGARSFGEPTAGLTTVTQMYTLADGSTLVLPVSVMGDRDGRAWPGRLMPNEAVAFDNWPSDGDAVVSAAVKWIISQPGP
jgi:hypothetical protein